MTYEELNKSNIPLITMDFIDDAIKKFSYLKDNIDNMDNIENDNDDIVDLSFLFSALTNDLFYGTKEILETYDIEEYKVGNYFNVGIGLLKLVEKSENEKDIYNKYFKEFIDNLLTDYKINIEELYPEDIIIDMLQYIFMDRLLFDLRVTNQNIKFLENNLKEMKIKRLYNKKAYSISGIPYEKINSKHMPPETAIYMQNSVKWYNILFDDDNYKCDLIKTEEDKIYLSLFLPILEIPRFDVTNFLLDFLSPYGINEESILNYYNINEIYLREVPKYTDSELEYTYNDKFKSVLNNLFIGIQNNNNFSFLYPDNFYREISKKDIILNLYKNFNLNDDLIKDLSSKISKQIIKKQNKDLSSKKENNKFFDINNYRGENYDKYGIKDRYNNPIEKKDKYELLKDYGNFLDEKEYFCNPALGREEEIKNILITLLKPNKSAILVGDAGVGKTAVVEGLAYLLQNKNVPEKLKNLKIISITTSSLLAGCVYRGQFEQRVKELLEFLKSNKEIVLFIDEIHTIMGAGSAKEQKLDFANILKPYLDRGDIKIIGSTTKQEYDELITDSAIRRRFEKTIIKELDNDKLKIIINTEIKKLENNFSISFDFDEIEKNYIINVLLSLTDDKNKVYNDKVNNPDLVLSILGDVFANASYNDRDKIKLEDIEFAINRCDRIYDSVRKREVLKLQQLKKISEVSKCKILKLYPDKS